MFAISLILNLFVHLPVQLASAEVDTNASSLSDASLIKGFPKEPLLNEIVIFTPVAGHKFNLEAKNACGNGALVKATEKEIKCQMTAPGASVLQLYVCDDKKTYCRREELNIKTQQPKGVKGWLEYYKKFLTNRDSWSTPGRSGVSTLALAQGFENGDFSKVSARAKKEKKNIIVFFTQAGCGGCVVFKELVIGSPEFQDATKNYIRYQMDMEIDMPPALRDLHLVGGPAVVVFNKDSKELGRSLWGLTPKTSAIWLRQLPSVPLQTLADRKIEKLSDEEKFRVSLWYSLHFGEKWQELAKTYSLAIQNPTPYMKMAMSYYGAPIDFSASLELLKKNEANLGAVAPAERAFALNLYDGVVGALLFQLAFEKDKKNFTEVLAYALRQEKRLLEYPDLVDRDLELVQLYMTLVAAYGELGDGKEAQNWRKKEVETLDRLLKLPYLPAQSQFALFKVEATGDTAAQEQFVAELKEKNKEDYSVYLYGIQRKIAKKDFDGALVQVDRALAVAKDGGWQSALISKIEILREARRISEAQKLIGETLEQTQLPNDADLQVHLFVQNLRKEQVALTQIK